MYKSLFFLIIGLTIVSCADQAKKTCDCLEEYEILQISHEEVASTINCLEENGVVLSLENDQTASLIIEMEVDYPMESRKLWMLCANIDDGVIDSN